MHILNHPSVSELLESSTSVRVLWITNLCPHPSDYQPRSNSMVAVAGIINLSLSPLNHQPLSASFGLSTSIQLYGRSCWNHQPQSESLESPTSVRVPQIINLGPTLHMSQLLESSTSVWVLWISNVCRVLRIINLGPTLCRSCWNHQPQSESFESPTSVRVPQIINLGPSLYRRCWNYQPQSWVLWINNQSQNPFESPGSVLVLHSPTSDPPVLWIINLSPGPLYHQPQSESFKSTTQSESFWVVSLILSTSFTSIRPSSQLNHQPKSWSFVPSTSVWGLWIIRLSLSHLNHQPLSWSFVPSTSVWGLWIIRLSLSPLNHQHQSVQAQWTNLNLALVPLCILSMYRWSVIIHTGHSHRWHNRKGGVCYSGTHLPLRQERTRSQGEL